MISFNLSLKSVNAILPPLDCPFASASAKCSACIAVTYGGIGGANGSTASSTIEDLPELRPCCKVGRISSGLSTVQPKPPQASAYFAKLGLCSSQPYSGLPRKTICSHLIWPSVLFLMITTTIGKLYLTAVRNSPINIVKPPSPTKAID